jgi:hypothetical protein
MFGAVYLVRTNRDAMCSFAFDFRASVACIMLVSTTNIGQLKLLPWKSKRFGGFPTKKAMRLALAHEVIEAVPTIAFSATFIGFFAAHHASGVSIAVLSIVTSCLSLVLKGFTHELHESAPKRMTSVSRLVFKSRRRRMKEQRASPPAPPRRPDAQISRDFTTSTAPAASLAAAASVSHETQQCPSENAVVTAPAPTHEHTRRRRKRSSRRAAPPAAAPAAWESRSASATFDALPAVSVEMRRAEATSGTSDTQRKSAPESSWSAMFA